MDGSLGPRGVLFRECRQLRDVIRLHPFGEDLLGTGEELAGVEPRLAKVFEQLIQRGRLIERATRSAKLLERVPANYQVIEFGTMTDDGLPVASGTDVELKALSAMFQRQIESTQSILRSITPGAAMSDQ